MGVTSKYSLPYPADSSLLKDVAGAIASLAQAVEDALLHPVLVTTSADTGGWGSDKTAEIGWDSTDDATRKRGTWDSTGNNDQLVIPRAPGWYMVAATVRFGGKAEPDWYDLQIRTRQVGDAVGSGGKWAGNRVEMPADSASYTELCVTGIVRIPDTTPRTGIAIRAQYNGSSAPPAVGSGVNKLSVHRLSAL